MSTPSTAIKIINTAPTAKAKDSTNNDLLRHLAFDNSLQPNLISILNSGKILLANKAACKLLGYSMKELLTKTRSDIFDIKETEFKKLLKQKADNGQSVASVSIIKKNGKKISCEISSAVFIGMHKIKKTITTITNKSKNIKEQQIIDEEKEKVVAADIVIALAKSDALVAENNVWIKNIAKTSYDVMWDWNVLTGSIYVGDSVKETFGYPVKNNTITFNEFCKQLLPKDKEKVKKKLFETLATNAKSWNDAYILKCFDGSLTATVSRASIIRDDRNKVIRLIGATQDVSRVQHLEAKLEEKPSQQLQQNDLFNLAAKLSYDGIWDWNLITGVHYLGEGFETLFGTSLNDRSKAVSWLDFLYPGDRAAVEEGIKAALDSQFTNWEQTFRFVKADGSTANVTCRANIIRNDAGKATRMIGVVHDLSPQRDLEEKLLQEIHLREKQITDAANDAKETERSNIGRELHDNVNQLLGASRMFLELAKQGGDNSAMYLGRSSEYTLAAIEEIRKLTKGLVSDIIRNLGLCTAIENLVEEIMAVNKVKISCSMKKFTENKMNEKFKLTVYRIVQEHFTNILKHANAKQVKLRLSENKAAVILNITDDGIGFDITKKKTGSGLTNIQSRVNAFQGKTEFISQPSQGCIMKVSFPITELIAR